MTLQQTQQRQADALRMIREWQNMGNAGKVCAIAVLVGSYLFNFVVLFSAGPLLRLAEVAHAPLWLIFMRCTVATQLFSIMGPVIFLWVLRICGVQEEKADRYGPQLIAIFALILTILWWTSTVLAFIAHPSCAADSTWLASLVPPSAIPSDGQTAEQLQVAASRCPGSLVALTFSVINALIFTCAAATLIPDGYDWLKSFLDRRRRENASTPSEPDGATYAPLVMEEERAPPDELETGSNRKSDYGTV